jgi:hypothetical protein
MPRDEAVKLLTDWLLEHQMPWGEWGAIGENAEYRNISRNRQEYLHSPIPKENVFRTVVAVEALRGRSGTQAAIDKAHNWMRRELLESARDGVHEGVWTMFLAVPAGVGPALIDPDLIETVDLRHTAQAWWSLLSPLNERPTRADVKPLRYAVRTILSGHFRTAKTVGDRTTEFIAWPSLLGSARPNIFASSCCLAFLVRANEAGIRSTSLAREVKRLIGGARPSLWSVIVEMMRRADARELEDLGRSAWVLATTEGATNKHQASHAIGAIDQALERLGSHDRDHFAPIVRLAAARLALDRSGADSAVGACATCLKRSAEYLIPPDVAFSMLVLSTAPNPLHVVIPRCRPRRTLVLQAALQERLQVFEYLDVGGRVDLNVRLRQMYRVTELLKDPELVRFRPHVHPKTLQTPGGSVRFAHVTTALEPARRGLIDQLILGGSPPGVGPSLVGEENRAIRMALALQLPEKTTDVLCDALFAIIAIARFFADSPGLRGVWPDSGRKKEALVRHLFLFYFEMLGFQSREIEGMDAVGFTDVVLSRRGHEGCDFVVEFKQASGRAKATKLSRRAVRQGGKYKRSNTLGSIGLSCRLDPVDIDDRSAQLDYWVERGGRGRFLAGAALPLRFKAASSAT